MNTVAKYDPPSALDRIDLDTQCLIHSRFFHDVNTRQDVLDFEKEIMACDGSFTENPYPLFHKFTGGMYTREIHIRAGDLIVGSIHKYDYFVNVVKGRIWVVNEFESKEVVAPCQFIAKAGVKNIGYTLEDTVWIDTHKTDCTTIEAAEAELFTESYDELDKFLGIVEYQDMCADIGFTEGEIRTLSEGTADMVEQPDKLVEVRASDIEGLGMFLVENIKIGERVGVARIEGSRTPLGRYTNHSGSPNTRAESVGDRAYLVATEDLEKGVEITVDYRNSRKVAESLDGRMLCLHS